MMTNGNYSNTSVIDSKKIKEIFKKIDPINESKKIELGNELNNISEKINKRFNNIPIDFEDLFETDRPTLGRNIDVVVYRALILSIMNHLGFNSPSKLYHAGIDFGKNLGVKSIDDMIYCIKSLGIGIPKLISKYPIKLQVSECIFCSGLPNVNRSVCHFERGMLAGCLSNILGKEVKAIETKCCATGHECCEFEFKLLKK